MRNILIAFCALILFAAPVCAHPERGGERRHAPEPHVNDFYFYYMPNPYSPYDYRFEHGYGYGFYYGPGYDWPEYQPHHHERPCR